MRFFADENTPRAVVQWMREVGHDVTWAPEVRAGESDEVWLRQAEAEERLVVTSDKDFGDMVFRDRLNTHGVLLLRLEGLPMAERIARLSAIWAVIEANPRGSFIVVSRSKVRSRGVRTRRGI